MTNWCVAADPADKDSRTHVGVLQNLQVVRLAARIGRQDSFELFDALNASTLPYKDPTLARSLVHSLNIVELTILIAAKHLSGGKDAFNFEMCWDACHKHGKRVRAASGAAPHVYARPTAAVVSSSCERITLSERR